MRDPGLLQQGQKDKSTSFEFWHGFFFEMCIIDQKENSFKSQSGISSHKPSWALWWTYLEVVETVSRSRSMVGTAGALTGWCLCTDRPPVLLVVEAMELASLSLWAISHWIWNIKPILLNSEFPLESTKLLDGDERLFVPVSVHPELFLLPGGPQTNQAVS